MSWKPITGPGQLPREGELESEILDFKKCYPKDARKKKEGQNSALRDIASFANAFGGTILVGAEEVPETSALKKYVGIPDADAEGRRIKQLALSRLDPQPDVETVPIEAPGGVTVLAVNVAPFPGVVAVRHEMKWEFCVRRERLNDQIAFGDAEKMLIQDRRGRLLLETVPEAKRNQIEIDAELRELPRVDWELAEFGEVSVTLQVSVPAVQPAGPIPVQVPYAFIQAVWPNGDGIYTISINAVLSLLTSPKPTMAHKIVVQSRLVGGTPPKPYWTTAQ